MRRLENAPKCLIHRDFDIHPIFLWITLLIVVQDGQQHQENQGSRLRCPKI